MESACLCRSCAQVAEVMGSDVVQQTLQQRLEDERKRMEDQARG